MSPPPRYVPPSGEWHLRCKDLSPVPLSQQAQLINRILWTQPQLYGLLRTGLPEWIGGPSWGIQDLVRDETSDALRVGETLLKSLTSSKDPIPSHEIWLGWDPLEEPSFWRSHHARPKEKIGKSGLYRLYDQSLQPIISAVKTQEGASLVLRPWKEFESDQAAPTYLWGGAARGPQKSPRAPICFRRYTTSTSEASAKRDAYWLSSLEGAHPATPELKPVFECRWKGMLWLGHWNEALLEQKIAEGLSLPLGLRRALFVLKPRSNGNASRKTPVTQTLRKNSLTSPNAAPLWMSALEWSMWDPAHRNDDPLSAAPDTEFLKLVSESLSELIQSTAEEDLWALP